MGEHLLSSPTLLGNPLLMNTPSMCPPMESMVVSMARGKLNPSLPMVLFLMLATLDMVFLLWFILLVRERLRLTLASSMDTDMALDSDTQDTASDTDTGSDMDMDTDWDTLPTWDKL